MSDYTMALFGSGGGQIHRQVFGAGAAPLYLLVSGVRSYAYQDGLGSLIALANGTASPAGALAGSYAYDAFGQTPTPTGPVFRYAGQRFDPLTGLVYDNARFYAPTLGRFLQPDPIGYAGGNNLYAYARNDPLNRVDPHGLSPSEVANPSNQLIAASTMPAAAEGSNPLLLSPAGDSNSNGLVQQAQFLPLLEIPPIEELTPLEELPPGTANGPRSGMDFPRNLGKPQGSDQYPPCTYCGGETGPGNYHRDHIIPKSQGGNGSGDNLAPSCQSCNLQKGPRTPQQWYL